MRWRRRVVVSAPLTEDPETVAVLADQRWAGPRTLQLAGWAYGPGRPRLDLASVVAVDANDVVVAEGVLESRPDPRADLRPGDKAASHAGAAFVATIDLDALKEGSRVEIRLRVADGRSRRWNDSVPRSAARRRTTSGAFRGRVLRARWSPDHGLRVVADSAPVVLTDVAARGDHRILVVVEGRRIESLALLARDSKERRMVDVERQATSEVTASLMTERLDSLDADLVADLADGSTVPVVWGAALLEDGRTAPPPCVVRPSGQVGIDLRPALVIDEIGTDPEGVLVRGNLIGGPGDVRAELQSGTRRVSLTACVRESRAEIVVPYVADQWQGPAVLPADEYVLAVGFAGRELRPDAVRIANVAYGSLPVLALSPGVEIEVAGSGRGRVVVDSRPDLPPAVRSDHGQELLRQRYRATPAAPRRVAYFECYYGASATDSARALHDELARRGSDLELVWGLKDHSVPVPDGGVGVVRGSAEWWDVLAHARFLTFNAGLPPALVRRPGQTVIQTWHGTPLKLLGADRAAVRGVTPAWDDWTARSVARWDALLAPNPYSAEIFPRAWAYKGPVLQLGYPRNDALVSPPAEKAEQIRRRLAIPEDHLVVLYAPTWRDGTRTMPDLLDPTELVGMLGEGVTVLVRGHMNIARWEHRLDGRAVRDVTTYPEINDLYLVADVAVTDYSSIMFDFSVTGKPMVFFAPDLADYRDRRRGLYFDLEATAPGPVVATTREVGEAILGRESLKQTYADRYAEWTTRFNPRDDGRAAARVVDALFMTE